MVEYQQGEDYQEEEFTEEDLEVEGGEDTEAKITTIYGIPVKYAIIGGIAIVLILLVLILFATRKKSDDTEDAVVYGEDQITDVTTDLTSTDVSQMVQTTPDASDPVVTEDDPVVYDDDPVVDPVVEEVEPLTIDDLSDEDHAMLRRMGYTADEIQFALDNGFDVEALKQAALDAYDEEAMAAIERMSDMESPEFQYILEYSYLGLPQHPFVSINGAPFGTYNYSNDVYTVNADYTKCPEYGPQLYLKCCIAKDTYVFYQIGPERYDQLPIEGNIVLSVTLTTYGEQTYVTKVEEASPTFETIDASDATIEEVVEEENNENNSNDTDTAQENADDTEVEGVDSSTE